MGNRGFGFVSVFVFFMDLSQEMEYVCNGIWDTQRWWPTLCSVTRNNQQVHFSSLSRFITLAYQKFSSFSNQLFWVLFQGSRSLWGQGHSWQLCSFFLSWERGGNGDQSLPGLVGCKGGEPRACPISHHSHPAQQHWERWGCSRVNIYS